jgi:hypothetical protein
MCGNDGVRAEPMKPAFFSRVAFALLLLTIVSAVVGQSQASDIRVASKVGANVTIVANTNGHPFIGDYILSREHMPKPNTELLRGKTDEFGKVSFKGLKIGGYMFEIERAGVVSTLEFDVVPENGIEAFGDLPITWPSGQVFASQGLSGKLVVGAPDFYSPIKVVSSRRPIEGARLELVNAETGKAIEETLTDKNGEFSFEEQTPGFYLLKVKGDYFVVRQQKVVKLTVPQWLSVDLKDSAPQRKLDLVATEWGFDTSGADAQTH